MKPRPSGPFRPLYGNHDQLMLALWVLVLGGGLFATLWVVVSALL